MSMKKTLFAVSLSFLVIISQAGCGGGGSNSAGSAVTGTDSGSTPATGSTDTTAAGAPSTGGTATPATIPPTAGPVAPGPVASSGTTVATGAAAPVGAPAPAGTPAVSGTPATTGTAAATGVAKLAWDAGQAGATGFRVYYGTSSKSYTNKVSVGLVPSYSVTLPPGTYYFVVTAYDASGNESVYSNEVSKTIS